MILMSHKSSPREVDGFTCAMERQMVVDQNCGLSFEESLKHWPLKTVAGEDLMRMNWYRLEREDLDKGGW